MPGSRCPTTSLVVASLSPAARAAYHAVHVEPVGPEDQARLGQSALYRHTFVGREAELWQLQAVFDGAVGGRGALVAILGEPGIGKTSLCEQLAGYAASRGGRTLVGHCYEAGSLSLPYLPFVEALRSYVLERDPDILQAELGVGAAEVARIIPELRDLAPAPDRPPGDPEQERWRLFQSVNDFLRNASQSQPLVLVLEDLHDADRGTLDLLVHLSRNLQDMQLLLLGTYRDVEVDRTHPLSGTLAELRRSTHFLRLPLRGLTADEVQRLLVSMSQQDVPWRLAELVHRRTEGNPLFVQELLRFLVEQGLVEGRGGTLHRVGEETLAARIPEGLRDVIGKRLSRLSGQANQVLTVASVLGSEFHLEALLRVVQLPEEDVIAALEEAGRAALVEERPSARATVVYRFTHAFFRQTLYEEISAPRRIRWHQQVARALEQVFASRLEEHAAELAEHFAHSSDTEDLAKAIAYGQLAATRSMRVHAYGEAVRLLEQALEVQDVLDPGDSEKRCDLLLALGEAMLATDEAGRVFETVAPVAFALAEGNRDSPPAARAAIQALDALFRAGPDWSESAKWAARADQHAADGSAERVYADTYLGVSTIVSGKPGDGHVHVRRAVERARDLGDEAAYVRVSAHAVTFLNSLSDVDLVERLAEEFQRRTHAGVRPADLAVGLEGVSWRLLGRGEREAAEHVWRELDQLAERTHDPTAIARAASARSARAFIDGHLEEAASLGQAAMALANAAAVSLTVMGQRTRMLPAQILFYLGRPGELPLTTESHGATRPDRAERALNESWLGRCEEALRLRSGFANIGDTSDDSAVWILNYLLEVSIRCGDVATAEALVHRLSPLANRLQALYSIVSFGRLLGEAAAMLGRPDEAKAFYLQGLAVCRKVGFRPEIALICLDLAQLRLEHFGAERSEALSQLDFAIAEFGAMHMTPSLERAHALARTVQSEARPSLPSEVDVLTPREREVAALLARGLSNRGIAEALVITETTAEVHVKHILGKLGFQSRAQAAVWAAEHGLQRAADPQT